MTGGGRAPAVAHERAEKQDLGLDASSHFAAEGVLHSLTGPADEEEEEGGRQAFVQLPLSHLSGTALSLLFLHSLNSFFFLFLRDFVQPHEAMWLMEGYRSNNTSSEEAQGPHSLSLWLLGTGPAQRLE